MSGRVHDAKLKKKKKNDKRDRASSSRSDDSSSNSAKGGKDMKKRSKRKMTTELQNSTVIAEMFEGESKAYWEGHTFCTKMYGSVNCLFCVACNKVVASMDMGDVRQHCFGQKNGSRAAQKAFDELPEDQKTSKHWDKVVERRKQLGKRELFVKVRQDFAAKALDDDRKGRGDTLSDKVIQDRVGVVRTMWENGVPLWKLMSNSFLEMIEQPHETLGGYRGVADQAPLASHVLQGERNEAVKDKWVVIYFDGAKVNEMLELLCARYLDDDFSAVHIVLGAKRIGTNLDAIALEALVIDQLRNAGIPVARVVAAVSDSAAINPAAINLHNQTAEKIRFGKALDEETLFWLGCVAHAASNCGTVLRKEFPLLKGFMRGFKKMTNTSDAACEIWRVQCSVTCPGLTENRWWAYFDAMLAIRNVWESIPNFLSVATQRGVSKKSVVRMADAFQKLKRPILRAQIDMALGYGKYFRDACLLMETDGFTLPFVKDSLKELKGLHDRFMKMKRDDPIIVEAMKGLLDARLGALVEDTCVELVQAAEKLFKKFRESIWEGMSSKFPLFAAASLLHPATYTQMHSRVEEIGQHLDLLVSLKGLRDHKQLRMDLASEHSKMIDLSKAQAKMFEEHPETNTPDGLLLWWKSIRLQVPAFFQVFQILILIQPSSALVERIFSVIKAATTPQQNNESPETFEARVLALANGNKKEKKKKVVI